MRLKYNINDEPLIKSKSVMDLFLAQDNPIELIALYDFYYYTAKWQKTNQPKATRRYCMKGLKIGKDRYQRAHNKLKELGLIEEIINRSENGQIQGYYVKVNFIWSQKKVQSNGNSHQWPENLPVDKPARGKQHTNALNTNKRNALNTNKEMLLAASKKAADSEHNLIVKIFDLFKEINPTINYGHKTNREACKRLIRKFGFDKTNELTQLAILVHGRKYAPRITTPYALETKLGDLIAYYKEQQGNEFTNIQEF